MVPLTIEVLVLPKLRVPPTFKLPVKVTPLLMVTLLKEVVEEPETVAFALKITVPVPAVNVPLFVKLPTVNVFPLSDKEFPE